MAECLTSFSDEHLATELRARGWCVYARPRVQVLSYSRIIPGDQWDLLRNESPFVNSIHRQVSHGLGASLLCRGFIAFDSYDVRCDYYAREHIIEGSVGVVVPKPEGAKHA